MKARVTAARRIQFCAGHRVHMHESKCRNLHGHNYVAFFHAEADELDELGRVIDFSVIKERLGTWIDENWDHGFIVSKDDTEALALLRHIDGQKLFVLDVNPTAENMALELLNVVAPKLLAGSGVRISKVVLWETENCFVEVEVPVGVERKTAEARVEVGSNARR
jgi:6-pyruvoyltetrahydropterin/6-carboxytetrahydropterin synthase